MREPLPAERLTEIRTDHRESRLYQPCGHTPAEHHGEPFEIDGIGWVCEDGYQHSVCQRCCIEPSSDTQTEHCVDTHDTRPCWPCDTALLLTENDWLWSARCSCDGDPTECSHEAARGQAEAQRDQFQDAVEELGDSVDRLGNLIETVYKKAATDPIGALHKLGDQLIGTLMPEQIRDIRSALDAKAEEGKRLRAEHAAEVDQLRQANIAGRDRAAGYTAQIAELKAKAEQLSEEVGTKTAALIVAEGNLAEADREIQRLQARLAHLAEGEG
ncbi:hypothetical protein ACQEU3_47130 [Spirillospora sp. CA-253888]